MVESQGVTRVGKIGRYIKMLKFYVKLCIVWYTQVMTVVRNLSKISVFLLKTVHLHSGQTITHL